MNDDRIGIGLIGAGAMGADHANTLRTGVPAGRVITVYDADPARAEQVAALSHAEVADSAKAVIDHPGVDGVVVASPDPTHEELVLACIAAGKRVLCEKPLAAEVAGSQRVVDAEVALGRRLVQVGFMRRFDPGYLAMKETLGRGDVGEPLVVHCRHRNAKAPDFFTSEMIVTNSMIHELDVARWLLDDDVVAVTLRSPRPAGAALLDPQLGWLETSRGAVVEVEVFVNCGYGYEVGCELVGSRGTVSLEAPPPVRTRRDGRDALAVPPDFRPRFPDAYRHELACWVESVAAGSADGPSSWDGHAANVLAQACIESLHGGRRVAVASGERPGLYGPEGSR